MQRLDAPRRLTLGTLVVLGDRIAFQPAPAAFEALPGEEVDIGVDWAFAESSPRREVARVALTLSFQGMRRIEEMQIEDRPVVEDRARGFLSHRAFLPRAGDLDGEFAVHVHATEGKWTGGEAKHAVADAAGFFRVRVT